MTDTNPLAPLWERMAGEPVKAYAAFCVYRDLGPNRSIDKAYWSTREQHENGKRASRRWTMWSSAYSWRSRAEAWDAHLDAQRRHAEEAAAAESARKWERRREEVREKEWATAQLLLEQADQIARWPAVRQTVKHENGRQITIIEPVRQQKRDAGALAVAGSKLARLSTGMETDRSAAEITGKDGERLLPERVAESLTDEQLFAVVELAERTAALHDAGDGEGEHNEGGG